MLYKYVRCSGMIAAIRATKQRRDLCIMCALAAKHVSCRKIYTDPHAGVVNTEQRCSVNKYQEYLVVWYENGDEHVENNELNFFSNSMQYIVCVVIKWTNSMYVLIWCFRVTVAILSCSMLYKRKRSSKTLTKWQENGLSTRSTKANILFMVQQPPAPKMYWIFNILFHFHFPPKLILFLVFIPFLLAGYSHFTKFKRYTD